MSEPARRSVAVVLDGPRPPAWQVHAVELLASSPRLTVAGVRLVDAPRASVVSRAQRRIERHLFSRSHDPLAPTDFEPRPASGGDASLTLWLASAGPPAGPDLIELRYGPFGERVEPAFRRAIANDEGVVVIEAILRRGGAGSTVVSRTVAGVQPVSLAFGLNLALWRSATLACRAAESVPGLAEPVADTARGGREPAGEASGLLRLAPRWGRVLLNHVLYRRPWYVLVRERREDALAGWGDDPGLVSWARGHTYADPFLFERDGRHHLFVEDVPPGTGRGVISHVELRPGSTNAGPPVPVLQADHHLSYPFVFSYDGEIYMIPESGEASQIQLYRASSFPTEWKLDRVLVDDIRAADATLLEADGRWWMLASVGGYGTTLGDELHVFFAASPLGPWTPHPANPVVSDIRAARPAGAILRDGDRVVRPAQDCSRRYGRAVSLREITVLDPLHYEERELERLEARDVQGARAVHTYARDGRYEAIDARRREWRLRPGAGRAARRRARSPG
jgi:hypothetical protein